MSLRQRLLAIMVVLLAASLLAGSALTYWHGLQKVELEMTSALRVGQNTIGDAIDALNDRPVTSEQLQRIVSSFDGDRHVRADLVSVDGTIILQSRVKLPAEPAPHWLFSLLTRPSPTASVELPNGAGRIELRADPLNEVTEVWDDAKIKLAIVSGFCALIAAMISFTLGKALKPLEDLSSALQKVGAGDYEVHVSEYGPQELAHIYRGFNTMTAKLSAAEQMNRRLNDQLVTVQDEERAEIARDLHDEVGPFLFAVDVDAQTIPSLLTKDAHGEVAARARAIRESVGHMQTHLRTILQRLQPSTLLDLGLNYATDQLAEFWQTRYPDIVFVVDCTAAVLDKKIEEAAYRILQEGTSNAVRHGKPSRIELSARLVDDRCLVVSVSDNGSGIRPTARKGLGLVGMRDRITLLGGIMNVDAGPGGTGVSIRASLPVRQIQNNHDLRKDSEGRL